MMFSDDMISELESKVEQAISRYRYIHTLGVKHAALKIAERCYLGDVSEIAAAALLHDISKEYSTAEQYNMIKQSELQLSDTDLMSEVVLHAFTAPFIIKRDFAEFATENILSSVFNHTTGDPNMSLFDEIIFVADYIEDGRKHESCVEVRNKLYESMNAARDREECIMYLHNATISALDNTIINLVRNKQVINERTVATRNAFLARVPVPLVY